MMIPLLVKFSSTISLIKKPVVGGIPANASIMRKSSIREVGLDVFSMEMFFDVRELSWVARIITGIIRIMYATK